MLDLNVIRHGGVLASERHQVVERPVFVVRISYPFRTYFDFDEGVRVGEARPPQPDKVSIFGGS